MAYGDLVPGDGEVSYAPSCIFHHVDGSDDEVLYVNQGTKTSCEFVKLDKVPNAYGTASGTGPSPAIWNNVDVLELMLNPQKGVYYFDDFMGQIDVTTADGWTLTQSNATGTIGPLTTDQGGVLQITSVGALADDSINAQLTNCNVKPASGVNIYFEARVNMTDATQQFVLGLAEVDTSLMAAGVLDDVVDKVVFYHEAASTDNKISAASSNDASEEKDADVAANVDNTYVKLGFIIEGTSKVTYYVNGVQVGTCEDSSDLPNEVMCLSAFCGYESAAGIMHIDWVRIAQVKSTDGGRA
ncbi:MAG: hypothetical protein GWN67_20505 [Phycisphaerae bacterium]|nr:hypothetical protein [Fodinibius sp.]NIU58677.1 hypothetical protein [Phycisphaerae bacterium]NIV16166.1 hypothetical protein [Fodinibius sp.]NIW94963.1 hypothetical protein [Phycisphaerae bacterium]NIY30147.1 hypothetical protein [Fodinibius sp.]